METKADVVRKLATGEGCLGRSADNEPVFILCARDVIAPATVRDWARHAAAAGAPAAKVSQALIDANAMERWQAENFSKVPD